MRLDTSWFPHVRARRPIPAATPWTTLANRLQRFDVFPSKDAAPLWSPVRYRPGATRGLAGVELVSLLVLDFDTGAHWLDVLPAWEGIAGVVHTSWSHTPEIPKWRLVIPLRAPVPAARWREVWTIAAERSGGIAPAGPVDGKCRDASRIFYVPAVRSDDAPRDAFELAGQPFELRLPTVRPPDPWKQAARDARSRRGPGHRFKTDPTARRELGVQLGGEVTDTAVKGVRCPACDRRSLTWWIGLGARLTAWCNHRNSCGAVYWLDELV